MQFVTSQNRVHIIPAHLIKDVEEWTPTVNEEFVLESVVDSAYSEFDGLADSYLDSVTAQDEMLLGKMLINTFNEWAKKTKNESHMFNVVETKEYDIL